MLTDAEARLMRIAANAVDSKEWQSVVVIDGAPRCTVEVIFQKEFTPWVAMDLLGTIATLRAERDEAMRVADSANASATRVRNETLEEAARCAEWACVMDVPPRGPAVGFGADPTSARNISAHIRALKRT